MPDEQQKKRKVQAESRKKDKAIIDGGILMRNGLEYPYAGSAGTSAKGLLYIGKDKEKAAADAIADQKKQTKNLKERLVNAGVPSNEVSGFNIHQLEARLEAASEAKEVTCSSISDYPENPLARSDLVLTLRKLSRQLKQRWKRRR